MRIKANGSEVSRLKIGSALWNKPITNLNHLYGNAPGRISVHLSTDNAVVNGSGLATRIVNAGAGGTLFDASIVGNPLVINANKTIQFDTSSSYGLLTQAADIMNVRMMFVSDTLSYFHNMRIFGGNGFEIVTNLNQSGWMIRPWSNSNGIAQTINTNRWTLPATGLHLFEVELTNNSYRAYLNGVMVGSASYSTFSWPNFLIDRIGRGSGTGGLFVGAMGDVLGVTLGEGSDRSIGDVRRYLNRKYSLGLTL